MKRLTNVVICCLMFSMSGNIVFAQQNVINGILDLRNKGFRESKMIDLNGEWEFYWNKHLHPSDFIDSIPDYPDTFGEVPSYWTNYKEDIPDITSLGICTYRMVILVPDELRHYIAFKVPVFDSSFRLYIDGKKIGSNGVAGEKASISKPGYKPFTCQIKPESDSIEIIINVSNFHHRRGGFWLPMTIGTPEALNHMIKTKSILDDFSLGILFAVACFFFLFYIIGRDNKTMIFFAIATLGILLRSASTGSFVVSYLWDINWIWLIRLEYTGSFLTLIFASWYFYNLFPDNIFKVINTLITVIFSLCIGLVLLSPVIVFSNTIRIFYPSMVVILIYYAMRSIISMFKGSKSGIYTSIGFLGLLVGAANDISLSTSNILISSYYIIPYTVTIFILPQVILQISSWVHSFNEEKRLSNELEYVNLNLENLVIERTSELSNQKNKIENQKNAIGAQNQELEKTISIMNRVFSIIAHDLKSPVLNLTIMIDLIKENKDKDDFDDLTDDLRKQAGFAINLIDNLLIWGKSQKNKIQYHPSKQNLTDIILENFSLLKEIADRKIIIMTYSHKGSPMAYCDKDLINIIIRNLLSNAIKFTKQNGKLSVIVEESLIHAGLVNINIKDNGIGITPDKIERIRNSMLIESTIGTEGERGTGLGLQLCHELVSLNKGNMTIESTEGKGTKIIVSLPTKS